MNKSIEYTGKKSQCVGALEKFISDEVTIGKPQYNHFLMVVEHLCGAFLDKTSRWVVKLEVDLETGQLSFSSQKAGVE